MLRKVPTKRPETKEGSVKRGEKMNELVSFDDLADAFAKAVVIHTQLRAAWGVLATEDHPDVFLATKLKGARDNMHAAKRVLLEAIASRTPAASAA